MASQYRSSGSQQLTTTIFRIALLLGLLAGGGVILFLSEKHPSDLERILHWFGASGVEGVIAFLLFFQLWLVCCMPSSIIELLGGWIYGFSLLGFVVTTVGKLSGSLLSFVAGRFLCREYVATRLEQRFAMFKAMKHLLAHDPLKSVFLVRVAMIPMALKNYGLGVLGVDLGLFVLASFFTGIPFTLVLIYLGSKAKHVIDIIHSHEPISGSDKLQFGLIILSGLATIGIVLGIGYQTRQYMIRNIADSEEEEKPFYRSAEEVLVTEA